MSERHPAEAAEREVVGGVLVHPARFVEIEPEVSAVDFWHPGLAACFTGFVALARRDRPSDAITLWDELGVLGTRERLNSLGGRQGLDDLMGAVVTVENLVYHARRIAQLAMKRRHAVVLRELAARADDPQADLDGFFEECEGNLLRLLGGSRRSSSVTGSRQGMKDAINRMEKRYSEREIKKPRGVMIGIDKWDAITRGLQPEWLVVIGARPGMGKSAMGGHALATCALDGIPTMTFALEMGAHSYFDRMLCSSGAVRSDNFRSGDLEVAELSRLAYAASTLGDQDLIEIDGEAQLPIDEMRARARRWRAAGKGAVCLLCRRDGEKRCDHVLVVVDYAQLARAERQRRGGREEEVAEVSMGLKAMAKELHCPVLALAQLSREIEKRDNKRPMMSDLRNSGQIEQDADIIAFLYREEEANPDKCPDDLKGTAELIIGKGRDLPKVKIPLLFDKEYTRFRNPSRSETAPTSRQADSG